MTARVMPGIHPNRMSFLKAPPPASEGGRGPRRQSTFDRALLRDLAVKRNVQTFDLDFRRYPPYRGI
jgi:hypothetical protein